MATLTNELRDTKTFSAGPLAGIRVSSNLYIVTSYGTIIGAVVRGEGYFVTTDKYSGTTSKHQNMIRKQWPDMIRETTAVRLEELLEKRTSNY